MSTTKKEVKNQPVSVRVSFTPEQKGALVRYRELLKTGKKAGIMLFIVCFIWISFDGYRRLVSKELIQKTATLTNPLNPHLDKDTLEKVGKKKSYSIDDIDKSFAEALETINQTTVASSTPTPAE